MLQLQFNILLSVIPYIIDVEFEVSIAFTSTCLRSTYLMNRTKLFIFHNCDVIVYLSPQYVFILIFQSYLQKHITRKILFWYQNDNIKSSCRLWNII